MIDCHVHSSWSDGNGSLAEIIDAASDKGLKILGIADHGPKTERDYSGISLDKIYRYFEDVENYKRHSRIKVLSGLEVNYSIENEVFLEKVLPKLPCDFLLGSVHEVNLNGKWTSLWEYNCWESEEILAKYFSTLNAAIKSGLFNGIAHPELILMSSAVDPDKFDEVIQLCADYKVAFEMNVSGFTKKTYDLLSKSMLEVYRFPNNEIIRKASEAGLDLLLGSDAHDVKHVGGNINLGITLLKNLGINNVSYFEKRKALKFQI